MAATGRSSGTARLGRGRVRAVNPVRALALFLMLACSTACQNAAYGPWPRPLVPGTQREYPCRFTHERPALDGQLEHGRLVRIESAEGAMPKQAFENGPWANAPWSEPFLLASGDAKPTGFRTWVKLLWDDRGLYIAALLEQADVRADRRERDAPLGLEDNFEVLLQGGAGPLHAIQVNAHGTIRDVRRDQPGPGTRDADWNCEGLDGAVTVQGKLNDTSEPDRSWTVEMAIPWACLGADQPDVNDLWKGNFLRNEVSETDPAAEATPSAWTPSWGDDPMDPRHWGRIRFFRTE